MIRPLWNGFLHAFMQDLMGELVGSGVPLDRGFVDYVLRNLGDDRNVMIGTRSVEVAIERSVHHLSAVLSIAAIVHVWPCDGPLPLARALVTALGDRVRTPDAAQCLERFVCASINALLGQGELLSPSAFDRHHPSFPDPSRRLASVHYLPRKTS